MVSPFFRIVIVLGAYPSISVSLPIFLLMPVFCSSTCPSSVHSHPRIFPPAHPCIIPLSTSVIYVSFIPLFPFFHSIHPSIDTHSSTHIHPVPRLPLTSHAAVHPSVHSHRPVSCSLCPSVPVHLSRFIHTPILHPATFLVTQLCHTLSIHVYPLSVHHPSTYLSFTYVIYLFSIHPSMQMP